MYKPMFAEKTYYCSKETLWKILLSRIYFVITNYETREQSGPIYNRELK